MLWGSEFGNSHSLLIYSINQCLFIGHQLGASAENVVENKTSPYPRRAYILVGETGNKHIDVCTHAYVCVDMCT